MGRKKSDAKILSRIIIRINDKEQVTIPLNKEELFENKQLAIRNIRNARYELHKETHSETDEFFESKENLQFHEVFEEKKETLDHDMYIMSRYYLEQLQCAYFSIEAI